MQNWMCRVFALTLWFAPTMADACSIVVAAEQFETIENAYFVKQLAEKVTTWIGDRTINEVARVGGVPAATLREWRSGRKMLTPLTIIRHSEGAANAFGVSRGEFLEAAGLSAIGYRPIWLVRNLLEKEDGSRHPIGAIIAPLGINRSAVQSWYNKTSFPRRWQVRALAMWGASEKNLSEADRQQFIKECYENLGYLLPPEPTKSPTPTLVAVTPPRDEREEPFAPRTAPPAALVPMRGHGIAGFRTTFVAPRNFFSVTALAAWRGTLPGGIFDPEIRNRFLKERSQYRLVRYSLSRLEARELLGSEWARLASTFGMVSEDVDFGSWVRIALGDKDLRMLAEETGLDEKRLRDEAQGNIRGQFNREEVVRIAVALGARAEEGLMAAGFFPTRDEFFASESLRNP